MLHHYLRCYQLRFGNVPLDKPEWGGSLRRMRSMCVASKDEFDQFVTWAFECALQEAPRSPRDLLPWWAWWVRAAAVMPQESMLLIGRIEGLADSTGGM